MMQRAFATDPQSTGPLMAVSSSDIMVCAYIVYIKSSGLLLGCRRFLSLRLQREAHLHASSGHRHRPHRWSLLLFLLFGYIFI